MVLYGILYSLFKSIDGVNNIKPTIVILKTNKTLNFLMPINRLKWDYVFWKFYGV